MGPGGEPVAVTIPPPGVCEHPCPAMATALLSCPPVFCGSWNSGGLTLALPRLPQTSSRANTSSCMGSSRGTSGGGSAATSQPSMGQSPGVGQGWGGGAGSGEGAWQVAGRRVIRRVEKGSAPRDRHRPWSSLPALLTAGQPCCIASPRCPLN